MHEWSIVRALLDRVEAEAHQRGATTVHRLHLQVGELSGVEVDLLQTAWETFREKTLCAGAPLLVERVPVRWSCPRCGTDLLPGTILRCPDCEVPARLAHGDEIVLQRIEMEVP